MTMSKGKVGTLVAERMSRRRSRRFEALVRDTCLHGLPRDSCLQCQLA